MTEVVLHGELAKVVGRDKWKLEIRSPGEALRAIEANTGKVVKYLARTQDGYAEYRVLIDGKDFIHNDQLAQVTYKPYKRIDFVPVIKGADNSGGFLTAIGILLVVVAVVLAIPSGGTTLAGASALLAGTAPFYATALFTLGLALTVGGISQLVLGTPTTAKNEKPQNTPSDLFNGPVNTYHQGNPVPVGYGELRVGSAVISASVRTLDIPENAVTTPLPAFRN